MKILNFEWNSFTNKATVKAFEKLHIEYDSIYYIQKDWDDDEEFYNLVKDKIANNVYDAAFSINYAPMVSKACEEAGLKYISWVYDAPLHIRNLDSLWNSCNEIYFFDRGQANDYAREGIHAYHMPLAADPVEFNAQYVDKYACDVAFVGKMYRSEYDSVSAALNEYQKGYLEGIVNAQSKVYGGCFIPELIKDDFIVGLNEQFESQGLDFRVNKRQIEYLLECEVTARERFMIISILSNHFDLHLYSDKADERIPNAQFKGYCNYDTEMPHIFRSAKVNLNISLRAIQTGLPLRVIDVLACRGFLISNLQEEITELLTPGQDLEVYTSIPEMYEIANFYMKNDEARERIAMHGYETICKNFTYEDRIRRMFGL